MYSDAINPLDPESVTEALKNLIKAVNIFESTNKEEFIRSLGVLSQAYLLQGDLSNAKKVLLRGSGDVERIKSKVYKAFYYYSKSWMLFEEENYEEVLIKCELGLKLLENQIDIVLNFTLMNMKGYSLLKLNRIDESYACSKNVMTKLLNSFRHLFLKLLPIPYL